MFIKQNKRTWTVVVLFSVALMTAFLITDQSRVAAAPGALDNSFDGNGRLATDFSGGVDVITDVIVQPDGKIVVVGINGTLSGVAWGSVAIARYNVDGSLDTTFSSDGKLLLSCSCRKAVVTMSAFSPSIYIAYLQAVPLTPSQMYVTKLTSNGSPDTSFGSNGTAVQPSLPETFVLGDIFVHTNSRPIVVGGSSDWFIYRFTPGGDPDTGFSGDGRQETDFGGNTNEYATSVTILSNGRILVGGTGNPAGQGFGLAMYTTNGSLDTEWGGGDGKVFTDITPNADIPLDMKVRSDGRIFLAGSSRPMSGVPIGTIVRYHADGLLDTSFDGDGIVQSNSFGPIVESIALQIDGKVIAVGGTTDFIVARLNHNGAPDTDFGNGGFVVTDMTNGSDDKGTAVAISFDRRIVVAGSTLNTTAGATRNFCVARYLPTNRPYQAPFDFDGDNKSDSGIFRPGNGQWWINQSSTSVVSPPGQSVAYTFGNASNRLAPVDFTGDGKADVAFWRPQTGEWFILRSEDFSFYSFPFGTSFDVPVPGDYDADGKADAAVFRPSNSTWYITQSSGVPTQIIQFGTSGDQPVVADYDEDGRTDIAIFRPGPRQWWIQRSTLGLVAMQFGSTGDKPVQGDYTGDGKADVAVFRPSTGEWFILRSDDFSFYGFTFGIANDVPAPADYDGDGRIDPTVVRNSVGWYFSRSSAGTLFHLYGAAGDRPIANAFVP